MKHVYYYETSIGRIGIAEKEGYITDVILEAHSFEEACIEDETPLLKRAAKQLNEYLAGERQNFDLPLRPEGTPFRKRVWDALCEIPYGETRSYKEIAKAVGNEKACRAVGGANNKNPISIFIPCHRVVGADGKLVGYGGGIDMKIKLLELEKR